MSYKSKFLMKSRVDEYFSKLGIRRAGDVKDGVIKWLDKQVEANIQQIIDVLPKKSKGKSKGELKRKTIMKDYKLYRNLNLLFF